MTRQLEGAGLDEVLGACDALPRRRSPMLDRAELALAIELGEALCTAVHRRAPTFPDTCLYRSLARFAFVSELDASATFVLGVRATQPSSRDAHLGHAWIELDGRAFPPETDDGGLLVSFRHRAASRLEPRAEAS